jgi:hypothetical protein
VADINGSDNKSNLIWYFDFLFSSGMTLVSPSHLLLYFYYYRVQVVVMMMMMMIVVMKVVKI